jgi:hypothetical protein
MAGILEGDPLNAGGRIDLTTGEVWPQAAIEYTLETGEEDEDSADDPERWLPVHNEGSQEAYRDMESFIASVEDPGRAERLAGRSKAAARSATSRTSSPAGLASSSDGMRCPRSANAAGLGHGSPRPATACCPLPAEICEPPASRARDPPSSARVEPDLDREARAETALPETSISTLDKNDYVQR